MTTIYAAPRVERIGNMRGLTESTGIASGDGGSLSV